MDTGTEHDLGLSVSGSPNVSRKTGKAVTHVHAWKWYSDINNQPYGLCECGQVNDDFREPERTI